ncbi:MAG: response regulator, partial [Desulfobacterales bacterium]|nr:response regulator [Desulfobacterales bacterium]
MEKSGEEISQARKKWQVLVVEDDEGLNRLAQKVLNRAGFRTSGVKTGAEAVDRVINHPGLILLLDQRLPDMSGIEVIRDLNAKGFELPFIAMTGQGDEKTAVDMMKLGAREYLVKTGEFISSLPGVFDRLLRELVTEEKLKKAENALKISEERYNLALEFANDGLYDWNLVTDEIYYSPGWKRLLGYRDDEIKNEFSEWERLTREEDVKASMVMLKEVLEKKRHRFEKEMRMRHKDGYWVDILSRANVVRSEDGTPVRVVGTHVDISERKKIELDLKNQKTLFEKVFNSQLDAIFILSATLPPRVKACNLAVTEIFGYSGEELFSRTTDMLHVDQKHIEGFRTKLMPEIERSGFLKDFPFHMKRKNGEVFPSEHTVVELTDEQGARTGWVSIVRDLTQRRDLESRLQQAQKMEAIGTLAGGIAHDFNNILFPLLGYSELLKEDLPMNSPLQDKVAQIMKASLRAKELVKQILSVSRHNEKELKPVRLQSILGEALKLLRSSIPRTITMDIDIDRTCGMIIADPTQVHQIIMNLATNAYHAMQNTGGVLSVTLRQTRMKKDETFSLNPGDYALLTVSDTGTGMTKDLIQKIFDPYFTTKETGKGTGLGLSVVRGIVKSINGDIRVNSEPDKGTEITVYLPVMEQSGESETPDEGQVSPRGSERILLIDDEEAIIKMEEMLLTRLGYRVTCRTDSLDSLDLFKKEPEKFDLVISDMTMPGMTGLQLSKEMKRIRP